MHSTGVYNFHSQWLAAAFARSYAAFVEHRNRSYRLPHRHQNHWPCTRIRKSSFSLLCLYSFLFIFLNYFIIISFLFPTLLSVSIPPNKKRSFLLERKHKYAKTQSKPFYTVGKLNEVSPVILRIYWLQYIWLLIRSAIVIADLFSYSSSSSLCVSLSIYHKHLHLLPLHFMSVFRSFLCLSFHCFFFMKYCFIYFSCPMLWEEGSILPVDPFISLFF